MSDDYRATGAVREALRGIYAFCSDCMEEDALVRLFELANQEWDSFPALLTIALRDTTKGAIANAYHRAFGTPIPRRSVQEG